MGDNATILTRQDSAISNEPIRLVVLPINEEFHSIYQIPEATWQATFNPMKFRDFRSTYRPYLKLPGVKIKANIVAVSVLTSKCNCDTTPIKERDAFIQ